MATVEEVLELVSKSQQKLAVWEHLINHLENNYMDTDSGDAPKRLSLDGCIEPVVTQSILNEVIEEISDSVMGPLQVEAAKLMQSEVKEEKKGSGKKGKKKGKEDRDGEDESEE